MSLVNKYSGGKKNQVKLTDIEWATAALVTPGLDCLGMAVWLIHRKATQ